MLLPELPDPLPLPWDAELPDWPLPEADPLPLWAMANAAETIKIARIWSKRFIANFPSLLVQAGFVLRRRIQNLRISVEISYGAEALVKTYRCGDRQPSY